MELKKKALTAVLVGGRDCVRLPEVIMGRVAATLGHVGETWEEFAWSVPEAECPALVVVAEPGEGNLAVFTGVLVTPTWTVTGAWRERGADIGGGVLEFLEVVEPELLREVMAKVREERRDAKLRDRKRRAARRAERKGRRDTTPFEILLYEHQKGYV